MGGSETVSADEWRRRFNEVADENFKLKEEISTLKRSSATTETLNKLIEPYAGMAFAFMCWYSAIVGFAVFLHGGSQRFHLPTSVLEFMVGSTAVTVIGLVGMVLTGVFVTRPK